MGQGKQQLNLKKKDSEVIDSEVIIATRTTDGRQTTENSDTMSSSDTVKQS